MGGLLSLESLSLCSKLLPLLISMLLLCGLFSPNGCKFGLGVIYNALTARVGLRCIRGGTKLDPMYLGLSFGLYIMYNGLGIMLYLAKGLRSLCHNASYHFWIALYNDGLLREILSQVLLNMHLCVLLHKSASIDLHMYSDVFMSVGLENLWTETFPSSSSSLASWSSFPPSGA